VHLVQVIILQGMVLFQSLKFYDDEIPCKQANLLDTDLLVLDVIDDFELSIVTVDEPVAQEIWCRLLYDSTNFSIYDTLTQT